MQKTAYELRISDWISDVCSSDLEELLCVRAYQHWHRQRDFHSAVRRDYPVGCGIRGRNRIRCDAPGRCAAKAAGYWRACCLGLDGPNISPRGTATLLSMVPRPSRRSSLRVGIRPFSESRGLRGKVRKSAVW